MPFPSLHKHQQNTEEIPQNKQELRSKTTLWSKKVNPFYYHNNFVYCRPIIIIFDKRTLQEICNMITTVSPTNVVYVTALPHKTLSQQYIP